MSERWGRGCAVYADFSMAPALCRPFLLCLQLWRQRRPTGLLEYKSSSSIKAPLCSLGLDASPPRANGSGLMQAAFGRI